MAAAEAISPSLTSSQLAPEQYLLAGGHTLLSAEAAAVWDQALVKASAYLAELLTRADRDTLLNEVFGRAGTDATTFETNKQALLEAIGTTGLRIAIDLRSGTEMEGAIGAYAQVGPNGNEIIYINADWINAGNLSLEQLTAVVLEEFGHALDVRLNPGLESPGDEGELFANLITNAGLNADQIAAINTQNDWGTVQVDGQTMAVEKAVAINGVTSTTLGTAYTTAQTISPAVAAAISVIVEVGNTNDNGADILIAAYQGTSLIGWSVYDRATNLDSNTNSTVISQAGPVTLTFNLAQFNTSLTAGTSTTGLVIRAWQGTFNGSSASDVTTATDSGTATSVAFTPNTLSYSTTTTVSGTLTDGSRSRGWAVNASGLTPPTVTITDSDANTVNIADGTVTFTFTFTGAVTGFDTSKITVVNGTKGTFSGSGTTYTLVVTPTASSSGNISVDVITTGVTDAAGNGAIAPAQYTQAFDTLAPTLAITTPISTDGFVNNAEDESSLIISGTSSGADGRTVTVAVGSITGQTATIATGGAWSITLTSAQLKTLTEGSVNITANVSDTAGNPATQATASFVYDRTAPTLLSSTPADGASDAEVSNNLVLTFSETIAAGSGLISLYRADGTLVESFNVATSGGSAGGSVAFSGSAVTINPSADLVRGSGYYLQVAATAIRDGAGNAYAGINDATSLNFTTTSVTVSVGSITVSESSLYAVVAVGLDAAISDNLSFTPTLLSGTASSGSDAGSTLQVFNGSSWVSAAAGVSLAAGSTSLLLRVAINNDTTLEGLETFQISTGAINGAAAALTNAAGASGTVTIADDGSSNHIFDQDTNSATPLPRSADNDTPSIVVSSVIVSEASPYAVLEVSLTNPSNSAVSFTPSLQSGSATIGADTVGSTLEVLNGSTWEVVGAGQISFAAGVTSRLVRVAIANDSSYENSEAFTISTGAISGLIANPAGASGTVTIRDNGSSTNTFLATNITATPTAGTADNDTPVLPALSAAVLSNGNESGQVATSFRISRTNTMGDLVVSYRFGGNAIAESDYTNPAGFDVTTGLGTVTILAGQSSVDLSVPTLDDSAVDGNRSLSLLLQSSLTYTIAAATATATILDNDVAPTSQTPTFAISSASVVETDSGSNPIVNLIVSLSGPAATNVTVRVRTLSALSGSSATGGGDYVAISNQLLTFLPGSTSQLLPIQLLGDDTIEDPESFRIELFDANGANLPAAAATIEIVDNDSGKSLTINNSTASTSKTFSGGQYADILIGGSAADTISGDPVGLIGGGDAITGNGGADILTGGVGPDRFRYLSFSDSTLSSTDRIRDLTLTGNDQDRIVLAALPSALWNTGVIRPTSATLANAVIAAFADKDVLTSGNQALAAGEAVLFAYDRTPGNSRTRQWFVAVNDSSASFSNSTDLLINVTGLSSSFASGSLAPSLLFATT